MKENHVINVKKNQIMSFYAIVYPTFVAHKTCAYTKEKKSSNYNLFDNLFDKKHDLWSTENAKQAKQAKKQQQSNNLRTYIEITILWILGEARI